MKVTVKEMMRKDFVRFDTRTPAEYARATIPGAINIPILSNEERAIVGTIYKSSRDAAVALGKTNALKRIDAIVSQVRQLTAGKTALVFCWRGGMRSGSVVSFLRSAGVDAVQLEGGHKAYRRYVIDRLAGYHLNFRFIVLYGLTGTGKTEILRSISQPVLDLEDLASHRSSVFGALNLCPRTQVNFESLLLDELDRLNDKAYVFVEGESRKIGNVVVPEFLFDALKRGINVRVECDFEDRVRRIVSEYARGDLAMLKGKLDFFQKKLGKKRVEEIKRWFDRGEYEEVAAVLLKEYYDVFYCHTLDNIDYDYVIKTGSALEQIDKISEGLTQGSLL